MGGLGGSPDVVRSEVESPVWAFVSLWRPPALQNVKSHYGGWDSYSPHFSHKEAEV